jgi:hypothetical protein
LEVLTEARWAAVAELREISGRHVGLVRNAREFDAMGLVTPAEVTTMRAC